MLRTRLRLGFDLAVSSGQELVTTTADYVDHLVEHGETRVLALVLETIRGGDRLRWSLRRAREAGMEVVLLPVGHTPMGAAMVAAHSGAVAGGSAAWEALAADVAGHLVADLAEMGDTLALLASPRRPRPGTGIATVHDSGAERSLVADLAHTLGVPFADLSESTRTALSARLEPGLEPGNPLDAWNSGADTHRLYADCLTAVAADPAVGVSALAVDLVPEHDGDTSYPDAMIEVAAATTAPVVVLTGLPAAVDVDAADRLRAAGIPVLEGFRSGLLAMRHLLDAVDRPGPDPLGWRRRGACSHLSDRTTELLAAYGIPTPKERMATSLDEAVAAAAELGWPVVLKTAAPGITHRSDVGGVVVGIGDEEALRAAYADLAARLGPDVTRAPAGAGRRRAVRRHRPRPGARADGGGGRGRGARRADGRPGRRAAAGLAGGRDADARRAAAAAAARRLPRRGARRPRRPRRRGGRGLAAGPRPRRPHRRPGPEPRRRHAGRRRGGRRPDHPQHPEETT